MPSGHLEEGESMLGAIIGDVAGSRFEFVNLLGREKNFEMFARNCRITDDSLMTLAVAKALIEAGDDRDKLGETAVRCMKEVAHLHPNVGWGERFASWLFLDEKTHPYNSFGNGAGMRISPVGWVAESEDDVKVLSKIVTEVSHNHPEGLKGAEAVAMGVYLARTGKDKAEIREKLANYYPRLKDETFTIENIYGQYGRERGMWVTCQGSVPHAIVAFLNGTDFEDCIRNAVHIGGDSDTIGAMAGSIAEAYYGIPEDMKAKALTYLSDDLIGIYENFEAIRKPREPRKSDN